MQPPLVPGRFAVNAAGVPPHRLRWVWFVGSALGVVAAGVAASGLGVALPTIVRDLGLTSTTQVLWFLGGTQLRWILGATTVTFAVLMPLAAFVGRLLGHVRVHLVGAVCFAVGSGIGATAGTGTTLVVARLGQGAGAALMVPQPVGYALAWLGRVERAVVCAVFGVAFVSGTALGATIGIAVVEHASWRELFWLALVVAVVAGLAGVPMIAQRLPIRFDLRALLAAVIAVPAFVAILVPLVAHDVSDWGAGSVVFAAVGCLFLAGSLALDASRLGARAGVGGPVTALLVLAASTHLGSLVSYLQVAGRHSAQTVSHFGVLAVAGALFGAALAVVVGLRLDARIATVGGTVFLAAGVLVSLVLAFGDLGLVAFAADETLTGLGLGLLVSTLVRESDSGLVFAALPAGAAAGATLASLRAGSDGADLAGLLRDTADRTLIGSLVLLVAAVVVALLLGPRRTPPPMPAPPMPVPMPPMPVPPPSTGWAPGLPGDWPPSPAPGPMR